MIFEISCSADLACDQKKQRSFHGGPAVFYTLVGPVWGSISLPSLRHRGRSQKEPSTKFKTQSKNAPLKNQRFQFWRWLLKTATQGLVQVWKKRCMENQRFQSRGMYQNFATSSMHVKAEQTNSLIQSSVVCIWLAFILLQNSRRRGSLGNALPKHLCDWCLITEGGGCRCEQGRHFKTSQRHEGRPLVFSLHLHVSKVT